MTSFLVALPKMRHFVYSWHFALLSHVTFNGTKKWSFWLVIITNDLRWRASSEVFRFYLSWSFFRIRNYTCYVLWVYNFFTSSFLLLGDDTAYHCQNMSVLCTRWISHSTRLWILMVVISSLVPSAGQLLIVWNSIPFNVALRIDCDVLAIVETSI